MFKFALSALLLATAATSSAAVVPILTDPAVSWIDGTFTSGFAGPYADGFYNDGTGPTHGFNGFGQNGESILFNSNVEFNSLKLGNCTFCGVNATTVTVSLYDGGNALLASQTIVPLDTLALLTFDTFGVRKATFTFTGGNTNLYGDGRTIAFYDFHDVTYVNPEQTGPTGGSIGTVPDAKVWALLIAGFGLTGAALRRQRALRTA